MVKKNIMPEPEDNPKKYPPGKNPNSLKNLKSIKPGQVLNPKGKPKGTVSFIRLFNELLEEEDDKGRSFAKILAAKILKQAFGGSYKQQNMIVEKIDGKVPFRIAGAKGDDLFTASNEAIEKVFTNPKAMELAIKLSNCINEPKKDGKNNAKGDAAG